MSVKQAIPIKAIVPGGTPKSGSAGDERYVQFNFKLLMSYPHVATAVSNGYEDRNLQLMKISR